MLNTLEVYENAGMEAGRSARHGDAAAARQWREWMGRAVKLERAEDRKTAQASYDAAYKKAALPRGPVSNPLSNWRTGDRFRLRYDYNWRADKLTMKKGAAGKLTLVSYGPTPATTVAFAVFDKAPDHYPVAISLKALERGGPKGRKNPRPAAAAAPALPKSKQRELRAAVELYERFREMPPRRLRRASFRVPGVCLVIGELDFVGYTTSHAGKRVRYQHNFAPGARPLLCASADGRQLLILGGKYDFTADGIVDRR